MAAKTLCVRLASLGWVGNASSSISSKAFSMCCCLAASSLVLLRFLRTVSRCLLMVADDVGVCLWKDLSVNPGNLINARLDAGYRWGMYWVKETLT